MCRAAIHNLDGKTVEDFGSPRSPSSPSQLQPGMPNSFSKISFSALPNVICSRNLKNLGLLLDSNNAMINLAINALKDIEVDRSSVAPISKTPTDLSYPNYSDDEDTRTDGALLAHLVGDISEVDFHEADLDIKICDLVASAS